MKRLKFKKTIHQVIPKRPVKKIKKKMRQRNKKRNKHKLLLKLMLPPAVLNQLRQKRALPILAYLLVSRVLIRE